MIIKIKSLRGKSSYRRLLTYILRSEEVVEPELMIRC